MLSKIRFTINTIDKLYAALTPEAHAEADERRLRDLYRRDILAAITTIEDRLERLDEITRERCKHLTALRNEIASDFEE